MTQPKLQRLHILLLALITLAGGALRFYRLDWDGGHHLHPDERYITWVATTIRWPEKLQAWTDPTHSTLNPFYWPAQPTQYNVQVEQDQARAFAYGHFPLYLLVVVIDALGALAKRLPFITTDWVLTYRALALVGRALSAAFDTGTILVTFRLGQAWSGRLPGGGRTVGLIAAACVAFAPLHIQLAHFYAVDTLMTFFVTSALWFMVRYAQERRLRDGLAGGVCAGLAIGSKFTAVWLLLLWAGLLLTDAWPALQRRQWRALGPLATTLAAAFLTFAVTNPFALIELPTFILEISTQGAMARGSLDWPYIRQYHDTWRYLYPIWQMVCFSLGPALTVAGLAGLAWTLWRAWQQETQLDELTLVLWAVSYLVMTGGLYVKFIRYMLPVTPALAVLAATVLVRAYTQGPRLAGVLLIAVTLLTSGLNGWAFAHVYDGEHPWVAASHWIYANVPAGASLASEHWEEELPVSMSIEGEKRSIDEYVQHRLLPYDPDSDEKLQTLLTDLAASDYLLLPSHRLWGTIPRWPERYPLTTRYYQALFGERLGYRLEYINARYPHLGPVTLMDWPLSDPDLPLPALLRDWPDPSPVVIRLGRADESFTVYDHPLTLIFYNTERLSAEQMRERVVSTNPSE
ncbi:MAG: glycosyltransferase family 39 protein [Thermoflexales bacterium]|nr:glycosyltransferase family 39 protein [Thermoflexales bacterium]